MHMIGGWWWQWACRFMTMRYVALRWWLLWYSPVLSTLIKMLWRMLWCRWAMWCSHIRRVGWCATWKWWPWYISINTRWMTIYIGSWLRCRWTTTTIIRLYSCRWQSTASMSSRIWWLNLWWARGIARMLSESHIVWRWSCATVTSHLSCSRWIARIGNTVVIKCRLLTCWRHVWLWLRILRSCMRWTRCWRKFHYNRRQTALLKLKIFRIN